MFRYSLFWVVLGRPNRTEFYRRLPGSSVVLGRSQSSRCSFHIVFSVVQGRPNHLRQPETTRDDYMETSLKEFLLALQSYSFIPTRVYSSSATLIDNIFVNKIYGRITSGNIISDISDHYSQFYLTDFFCETNIPRKAMIRDFTRFLEENFNSELAQVDWESIFTRTQGNIDTAFSKIYNELNIIN